MAMTLAAIAASKLRTVLMSRGVTQKALAAELDITVLKCAQLCSGVGWKAEDLESVASWMGIDPVALITEASLSRHGVGVEA